MRASSIRCAAHASSSRVGAAYSCTPGQWLLVPNTLIFRRPARAGTLRAGTRHNSSDRARNQTRMDPGIAVEWLDAECVEMELIKQASWSPQRRSNPYNRPLAATLQWADRLPPSVKPDALLRSFPRIANQIAASWRDPIALNRYFESLLADERGGREGFPGDVRDTLVTLSGFYAWCQNVDSWSGLTLRP